MLLLAVSFLCVSCQKTVTEQPGIPGNNIELNSRGGANPENTPYRFERINEHNFSSQGWREQQVNIVSGVTVFSDSSDHVEIVCGPDNPSDPRLIQGCVTMNLPTGADPTLRRIRLRKGGYNGTRLADLTELKYSTYVIHNAPTIMVLQVDVNNDGTRDFNLYFEPTPLSQGAGFPPVQLNTWQQWNALIGTWHFEVGFLPEFPDHTCTISELVSYPQYADARIIDTPPVGHNGEGVRFTIGGTPRPLYDNTIGYFDALIIGTSTRQHSTLYDFTCDQSPNR